MSKSLDLYETLHKIRMKGANNTYFFNNVGDELEESGFDLSTTPFGDKNGDHEIALSKEFDSEIATPIAEAASDFAQQMSSDYNHNARPLFVEMYVERVINELTFDEAREILSSDRHYADVAEQAYEDALSQVGEEDPRMEDIALESAATDLAEQTFDDFIAATSSYGDFNPTDGIEVFNHLSQGDLPDNYKHQTVKMISDSDYEDLVYEFIRSVAGEPFDRLSSLQSLVDNGRIQQIVDSFYQPYFDNVPSQVDTIMKDDPADDREKLKKEIEGCISIRKDLVFDGNKFGIFDGYFDQKGQECSVIDWVMIAKLN